MPDPKASDVFEMLEDRKDRFRYLHTEMGYDEDLIEASAKLHDPSIMKFLRGFPQGFIAKVPSIAKDVIDVGINSIVGDTPVVTILLPPALHKDVDEARVHKRDLERKSNALLWYIETYSNETPFRGLVQHALSLGLATLAYPIIYKRWPKHPIRNRRPRTVSESKKVSEWQRTRMQLPFDVRVVHPRSSFFDPDHDPIENIIEEQTVSFSSYSKDYPHLHLPERGKGILTTYCSEDYYGQWLDRKPLLTPQDGANPDGIAENSTHILWYRIATGGFGDRTYKAEWEYFIKGIIRDGRDLILGHITSYNVLEVIRQFYAFVPLDISGPTRSQAELEAPTEFGPGMIWAHSDEIRNLPFQAPSVPEIVFKQLDLQQQELQVHFGPYGDALRGVYRSEPASSLRNRQSTAGRPYQQCRRNVERLAGSFLMDIFYYIKHVLKEPLTFPSEDSLITISPSDIPDGFRAIVSWSPPTPEERSMALQDLLKRAEAGSASMRRVLEEDDAIEDVDEEMAQILADRVMQSRAVTELLGGQATQRLSAKAGPSPAVPAGPGTVERISNNNVNPNGVTENSAPSGANNQPPMGYDLPRVQ